MSASNIAFLLNSEMDDLRKNTAIRVVSPEKWYMPMLFEDNVYNWRKVVGMTLAYVSACKSLESTPSIEEQTKTFNGILGYLRMISSLFVKIVDQWWLIPREDNPSVSGFGWKPHALEREFHIKLKSEEYEYYVGEIYNFLKVFCDSYAICVPFCGHDHRHDGHFERMLILRDELTAMQSRCQPNDVAAVVYAKKNQDRLRARYAMTPEERKLAYEKEVEEAREREKKAEETVRKRAREEGLDEDQAIEKRKREQEEADLYEQQREDELAEELSLQHLMNRSML